MAPARSRPWLAVVTATALFAACERVEGDLKPLPATAQSRNSADIKLGERPPMTKGAFPCSDCHEPDLPVKVARRTLAKAHTEITLVHGGEQMWCWDCHDIKNRDSLRTASGTLISYDDTHLLCGQCHGHVLRDWKAGAHGKRTGTFDGPAVAWRCASCHNAHTPHFKPLTPATMPSRPRRTP